MERPKPGNIIRIDDFECSSGDKEFEVVECPDNMTDNMFCREEVWFYSPDDKKICWIPKERCIVLRLCGVDSFLKQQLDDNLRSVFA